MRPSGDLLLRSIRESLVDVVIPNVSDDWARYVARSMEKILAHLELRWRYELEFLARDLAELHALLAELHPQLEGRPELAPLAGAVAGTLADGEPPAVPDLEALAERRESYRARLVEVIEELERVAADPPLREQLEPLRRRIRVHLRDSLERDRVLTRPTDMLFEQPAPRRENAEAR